MIANCQNCGAKSTDDELFCAECGHKMTGNRIKPETQEHQEKHITDTNEQDPRAYKEATWTLRGTIGLMYFGLFMSMAAAGVFFIAIPPSFLLSVPLLFLELWIAQNLGSYSKLSRYLLIIVCLVIVGIAIYIYPYLGTQPGLAGGFILSMALYGLYAMLGHASTRELFSGKYKPNPDYLYGKPNPNYEVE